jgi:hypothetical protein
MWCSLWNAIHHTDTDVPLHWCGEHASSLVGALFPGEQDEFSNDVCLRHFSDLGKCPT